MRAGALALLLLLVAVAATASVHAAAGDAALPRRALQQQQPAGSGTLRVRRDIAKLFAEQPQQRSLFLQALAAMQATHYDNPDSYFQLAGIHGLPNMAYQGIVNPDAPYSPRSEEYRWGGYCPHGSVDFPTWHRAYLLRFEEVLLRVARQISHRYTGPHAPLWRQAANDLALPYLDWTSDAFMESGFPFFLYAGTLDVITPEGKATIKNPLAGYKVPRSAPFMPYSNCTEGRQIGRHNTAYCDTSRSDFKYVNEELVGRNGLVAKWRSELVLAMASDRWACVADIDAPSDKQCNNQSLGLEGVHNDIHYVLGGWMRDLAHAAFDPIFFLHHSNVDRLLAIYQISQPDVWVTPGRKADGTFWYPRGALINRLTPLVPFYKPGTDKFYTSDDMRDWKALGYTYQDLDRYTPSRFGLSSQLAAAYPLQPARYSGFRYYVVLPNLDRNQAVDRQAAIRTFVFMPGATAATPTTDDNKRYAGLMVWVQDDAMGGMDDDGRVQLDLTYALFSLNKLKAVEQVALDPADPGKGPAPAKAPIRLADIKLVPVGQDGKPIPGFRTGEVLVSWSYLDPTTGKLSTGTLQ